MKGKENTRKTSVLPEAFVREMDSISDTCLTLSTLLHLRGLGRRNVYPLVRDIIAVVDTTSSCSLSSVNSYLESLGWPHEVLDEITFELVKEILFRVFEYQVEVYTVN